MARQHRLSRFPVYRDDLDHIVGVVHVKDLVGVDRTSKAKAHDIMRRVPAIPETLRLDQALAEFRRQHAQLAIVIDEYGGTAGLVTLEDVLEELIGEVGDSVEVEGYRFQVTGVDGRRVSQVRIQRARPPRKAA